MTETPLLPPPPDDGAQDDDTDAEDLGDPDQG